MPITLLEQVFPRQPPDSLTFNYRGLENIIPVSIDPFIRGDAKWFLIFGLIMTGFAIVYVIFAILPTLQKP
jgi:hypothetical protein